MPGKKARYEVLYEDILSRFDILIEGHQALKEMFERTENNLRVEFNEKINTTNILLEGVASTLSDKIKKVGRKVDNLDQKVNVLDQKVNVLDQKVNALDQKVNALDQKVEDVRIEIKNTRKELGGKIDNMFRKLEDHEIRIVKLEYAA
ncbi:MAG: hypothetical protein ABH886_01445 [Candidatus Desantisbacteria bacterium]